MNRNRLRGDKMIKVYGIKKYLKKNSYKISEVINNCLISTLSFPENKKTQRFIPMDKRYFYSPAGRSDLYTIIEISLMEGRKVSTKKELIKMLFREFEEKLNIKPIDLEIIITDQPPSNWGFRGMTGDEAKLNYKVNV